MSENGDAQAIARSASAVQAVKDAVAELRASVKSAVSHREKCSILLSAAMAASLALEQVPAASPTTAASAAVLHVGKMLPAAK